MNWNSFNALGYLSVILWVTMPLLWFVHSKMKPRRWLVHISLLVGVLALVLAKINSVSHVNRIQSDMSEQLAVFQAEQESKRQAALDSRGDEVAQIRFAEDGNEDFIDRAGMDESDIKYMEKLNEPKVPEWMKDKKDRSSKGVEDDSLEGMIGGVEESEGVESESIKDSVEKEPILMLAKDLDLANRLDGLNLSIVRVMICMALVLIVIDYLKRANIYEEAYFPKRLPSSWLNSLTPLPAVVERPKAVRRSVPDELLWLARRGDSFVCFTDGEASAEAILAKLRGKVIGNMIPVTEGDTLITDDFVFETSWYGRGSFLVNSSGRTEQMLGRFVELLNERRVTRARVRQSVHLVWDSSRAIPKDLEADLVLLGGAAGLSILYTQTKSSVS